MQAFAVPMPATVTEPATSITVLAARMSRFQNMCCLPRPWPGNGQGRSPPPRRRHAQRRHRRAARASNATKRRPNADQAWARPTGAPARSGQGRGLPAPGFAAFPVMAWPPKIPFTGALPEGLVGEDGLSPPPGVAAANLALTLRRLRRARGLIQRALTRPLHLNAHSAIADYETGRRIPPADAIRDYEKF